jgi:hypothetical protein
VYDTVTRTVIAVSVAHGDYAEGVKEAQVHARIIAASVDMFHALEDAQRKWAGWREAIALLEDHCGDSVKLKNMIAAIDQLDTFIARAITATNKAKGL